MIGPKLLPSARKLLYTRSHGLCDVCGTGMLYDDMHAHHRLLKSHGGTWALDNILGIHGDCHNVQPKSLHQNPKWSYERGYMVKSWCTKPGDIPILLRGFSWYLLNADGSRDPIATTAALELLAAAGVIPGDGVMY